MALIVRNNYKTAITTRPVSFEIAEDSYLAPYTVRAAIDSHTKQASKCSSETRVYQVNRVVKTTKTNSVMGQGLFISEEHVQLEDEKKSATPESNETVRYLPSFPPLFNKQAMHIKTASSRHETVDRNAGAREVRLVEPSLESLRDSHNQSSVFCGISAEAVPPELVARGLDLDTWRHFANALNAAVLCSAQEIGTHIKRWNADVFAQRRFQAVRRLWPWAPVSNTKAPTIVIHGGAGTILKAKMTDQEEQRLREGLSRATMAGYTVLQKGGSALDAVEAAVRSLEDNPLFNAGKGAVFNIDGVNQLEASIMNGNTGSAGAATLLTVVKNPIALARKVMESGRHVFMCGPGAESYAKDQGLDIVDSSYFWTKHRWEQHERGFFTANTVELLAGECSESGLAERSGKNGDCSHFPMGTVGAVAIDAWGNLAAATSTGGMSNKWNGRIGDTPIIGAGTWADANVAISGTGTGEYFIRLGTSRYIASRVGLLKEKSGVASAAAITEMKKMGGDGGVICIDSSGNFWMTFCSDGMYRGYCSSQSNHIPVVAIFKDEKISSGDNHVVV
ncbi:hypothetical protein GGF39_002206 [Coemansia sp. RSA 1721]|nr:hypothetical protein GGF39_002206 [Coemansia sp. RSA 1721]